MEPPEPIMEPLEPIMEPPEPPTEDLTEREEEREMKVELMVDAATGGDAKSEELRDSAAF